ncbi:O-methyltransferase [Marinimicrococcus flavescens]|uniref:Class I SAM-dependent methyltransferase n=1 Tax=Marinimicrococcus flavescens TaxID=3031815 RepID=A0AAP3V189_9PROT|nr:class I SAM-dependent methyltransferase [Marinimicrococcus flavescens]
MSPRTLPLDDRLYAYLLETSLREHPAQRALREATDRLPDAGMRSAAEQVQLLGLLIELLGARRILEVGCFTGYGALSMALAAGDGGRVVTLDVNEDWAAIGRRYWRQAGVEERIELRLGEALASLDGLLAEGAAESFDLAYVDADKKGYDAYYERVLRLLRPGGLVALDNVLWHGEVADPASDGRQVRTLRALNAKIREDERVSMSLVPIGDGLMLARKR